ncbi:MAG: hypothetical protein ACKO24_07680 [Leptolyngbyaceae cyanobacterium]
MKGVVEKQDEVMVVTRNIKTAIRHFSSSATGDAEMVGAPGHDRGIFHGVWALGLEYQLPPK